jgi:lipoyl synthase
MNEIKKIASVRRDSPAKPAWLKVKPASGEEYHAMRKLLRTAELNTICESGNCPNRGECFAAKTATFMIMGNVCSRKCTFCNVATGAADPLDRDEPRRVAETVKHLGLKFAVVTSVNRDEHFDGGSGQFAATIRWIRRLNPECGIEVLTPDFIGNPLQLEKVISAKPDVFAHNIETVPRLDPEVRPQASQQRSLTVLKRAKQLAVNTKIKTGVMLGLGETVDEVVEVMKSAVEAGVDIFTVGQYLQPTPEHHPVLKYYTPEEFDEIGKLGRQVGLRWVESGPLVRSSYHAREQSESHQKVADE